MHLSKNMTVKMMARIIDKNEQAEYLQKQRSVFFALLFKMGAVK